MDLLMSQRHQQQPMVADMELKSLIILFIEKRKELHRSRARVEALSRQLEELKIGLNTQNQLKKQQNVTLMQKQNLLMQRKCEIASIDKRIAELQERLAMKRILNNAFVIINNNYNNSESESIYSNRRGGDEMVGSDKETKQENDWYQSMKRRPVVADNKIEKELDTSTIERKPLNFKWPPPQQQHHHQQQQHIHHHQQQHHLHLHHHQLQQQQPQQQQPQPQQPQPQQPQPQQQQPQPQQHQHHHHQQQQQQQQQQQSKQIIKSDKQEEGEKITLAKKHILSKTTDDIRSSPSSVEASFYLEARSPIRSSEQTRGGGSIRFSPLAINGKHDNSNKEHNTGINNIESKSSTKGQSDNISKCFNKITNNNNHNCESESIYSNSRGGEDEMMSSDKETKQENDWYQSMKRRPVVADNKIEKELDTSIIERKPLNFKWPPPPQQQHHHHNHNQQQQQQQQSKQIIKSDKQEEGEKITLAKKHILSKTTDDIRSSPSSVEASFYLEARSPIRSSEQTRGGGSIRFSPLAINGKHDNSNKEHNTGINNIESKSSTKGQSDNISKCFNKIINNNNHNSESESIYSNSSGGDDEMMSSDKETKQENDWYQSMKRRPVVADNKMDSKCFNKISNNNNHNSNFKTKSSLKKDRKSQKDHEGLTRRVSFDPLALLLDAALEGELDLVKKTSKIQNVSAANDEGITALHNTICAGHFEIVKYLVEIGCDVNAPDSDGWTPLHCAASCNNLTMVKYLVEHGACVFATTFPDKETAAQKCEEGEEGFDGCSQYLLHIQDGLGLINDGIVYAVYDYDAQCSDELSFKDGDAINILRRGDEDEKDWWWARLNVKEGYVPRNLLGLYPRVKASQDIKKDAMD